ncbi:MAG: hypothetical protein ACO24P_07025 [Candidatus Nanopelagicaceae bacterium]
MDLIVFFTEGLQGVNTTEDDLNNAVLLELAVANNLRSQKQAKEKKGLVGDFKSEKSKHDT